MVDFWGIEISTGVGVVGAGALGEGAVGAASPPPAGWANAVGPTSRINHMTLNALDMFDLASIVDVMSRL
jgi:hypothetical protein